LLAIWTRIVSEYWAEGEAMGGRASYPRAVSP
jgi:hypothetical protein